MERKAKPCIMGEERLVKSLYWTPSQETETLMVRACQTPWQLLQNHPSGHLRGWATPWSAEEMVDGQCQRADIPAHCQNCAQWPPAENTGRESLLKRLSCPADDPIGQRTELNWTELNNCRGHLKGETQVIKSKNKFRFTVQVISRLCKKRTAKKWPWMNRKCRCWSGRIPGNKRSMQSYILTFSRLKGENLWQIWIVDRRDLNTRIRGTPFWEEEEEEMG